MELEIQKYLRNGGSLATLEERYAVKAKRHGKYPELVCLKYNQIESPFAEQVVQDCRGIILNEKANWDVVCLTFRKFFNHGEGHAAQIDWATAEVQEKLDGSLMQMYWYDGKWQVASSGTPDASGNVVCVNIEGTETFADLFWRTFREQGLLEPPEQYKHCSFAFELMTPFNRVIVPHRESRVVLLAVRNNVTGQEMSPKLFGFLYQTVRAFPLTSFDECVASFQHIDPLQQEGYVVVDGSYNRVKMKSPAYVALAHMRGEGFTHKRVLEIIRAGETGELLSYFPEWKSTFEELGEKFGALVSELETEYARLSHIPVGSKEDQKAFALEANKTRYPSALFQIRRGTAASVREYLASVNIKHLLQALRVKDDSDLAEAA